MNHAISGEILTKESRLPRNEIFFATLVETRPKHENSGEKMPYLKTIHPWFSQPMSESFRPQVFKGESKKVLLAKYYIFSMLYLQLYPYKRISFLA